MDTQHLLEEVQKEIKRLQAVEALLEGSSAPKGRRGRGTRKLSRKARNAIAAAQRKRWAKVRAEKKVG